MAVIEAAEDRASTAAVPDDLGVGGLERERMLQVARRRREILVVLIAIQPSCA